MIDVNQAADILIQGQLQKLIDVIVAWCKNWGKSLNVNKTKVVHFRRKGRGRSRSMTAFMLERKK